MHRRESADEYAYGDDAAIDMSAAEEPDDEHMMVPATDSFDGSSENFKVAIRVRPPVPRELEGPRPFVNVVRIPSDHKSITLCEHLDTDDGKGGVYSTQVFSFDYTYDLNARQKDVYERSAQPAVLSVLEGYNATVIAYGQTGTGKTFTMEGFTSVEQRGIIPRAIEEVFAYIDSCKQKSMKFLVRASYMQIYNEVISDLLKPLNRQLTVRHTKQRGVYIDGLSEWVVRSPNDVYGLMERGCSLRATGSTKMSELSSRSHAMFIVIVEVMEGDESNPHSYKFGKLNIVDLAGSEKVRQTGVTGQRLEETKKINWSLHELGNVIAALTDPKRREKHIPFRNSCLTSALRDSLGGNCKTTLIACISPALDAYSESLSTLKFANRAKNIKNDAMINEDLDQATLLRKYERELRRLRQALQERDSAAGGIAAGDPHVVISELRQGKRRAEEDRVAALEALEETSRAHREEQHTRARLEERINQLQQALQNGGSDLMAMIPGGAVNSEEYAMRLDELDKERQVMEEDKAQVDRYKQLLLKQRDIMLNLTTRLNERDETILHLQEEIDAYDAHIQMLEDAMDANSSDLTMSSRTEAAEHLAKIRCGGSGDGSGAATTTTTTTTRYRSEGNREHLLSAEEKIVELLMIKGRASASEGSSKAASLEQSDEKRALEVMLKDRVEIIANREISDRVLRADRDLDVVRQRLLASEEKRRTLEYIVEMAKSSSPQSDSIARAKKYMEQEQEVLRSTYAARCASFQQELEQERQRNTQLARELDRMRFDVGQARSAMLSASGATLQDQQAKRAELDRLWRAIENAEDSLRRDGLSSPSSPSFVPGAASGSSYRDPATPTLQQQQEQQRVIKQLEATIETTRKQAASQQAEFLLQLQDRDRLIKRLEQDAASFANRDKELASLNKSLSTHVKDRRALKTIMESRIKVKVDGVTDLLNSPTGDRQKMLTEMRALQNLVNASIAAMDSDS
jgi:hypothetical protein